MWLLEIPGFGSVMLNPELIDYLILHLKIIWLVQSLGLSQRKTLTMLEESSQNRSRKGCNCLFTTSLCP